MKTLHTPGPWFIERRTNDGGTTHHSITASDGHGWSCDRYMSVAGCIDSNDAHLIAAAPELLEALTLLVAGIENSVSKTYIPLVRANAAIAKATGSEA